jgi:3-isopropylmalate dehydrogenase
MLEISFGWKAESEFVVDAVRQTLKAGYRTADIADSATPKENILNTRAMGDRVVNQLAQTAVPSAH